MTKFSNEKVENLIKQGEERIKQEKERLDTSKNQMRDNHLINLGLIDESKIKREYVNYEYSPAKFDPETKKHYVEKHTALEVTDEEYEEICKYFPPDSQKKYFFKNVTATVAGATFAETTLNIIAIIVLVCGIIGALVCLFTITFVTEYGYTEFNAIGFITSIGVLLTSLTTWSVLRVFCEIAINVRQINNKAK